MAKWNIDPDHSVAGFTVRHMMVANIRGTLTGITGTILFDPASVESSSVQASLPLAGLSTGNKKREEHLMSADFFDSGRFPAITFRSTKVEQLGSSRGRITGELTMRGVTRPVTMEAEYFGPVKSPSELGGETTMGFAASLKVNREDFGIMWNLPFDKDKLVVSKDVEITLDVEADLAE
jgi:polyisoprenoid-binding protein YceI